MKSRAFNSDAGREGGSPAPWMMQNIMKVAMRVLRVAHDEFAQVGVRTSLDFDAESQTLTLQRHRLVIRRSENASSVEVHADDRFAGAVRAIGTTLVDGEGAEVIALDEFFGRFAVQLVRTAFPRAPDERALTGPS